jgi:hypothetical protein
MVALEIYGSRWDGSQETVFSEKIKLICSALSSVYPKAYRLVRDLRPFPSATTISAFMNSDKIFLGMALA